MRKKTQKNSQTIYEQSQRRKNAFTASAEFLQNKAGEAQICRQIGSLFTVRGSPGIAREQIGKTWNFMRRWFTCGQWTGIIGREKSIRA